VIILKKILLTLSTIALLTSCGTSDTTSSSNGSITSSVSSVSSSTFANATSLTISANSNDLLQTSDTIKPLLVTAALNANANPNIKLEWYVNGVKDLTQQGLLFSFTAIDSGTYQIVSKVGELTSNTIELVVGNPTLNVMNPVFLSSSRFEIKGDAGATVTVANRVLRSTSFYDLAKGAYVIDLTTTLDQGQSISVTLSKDGYNPITRTAIFDTRTFEVESLVFDELELTAVNGVYRIERPFDAGYSKNIEIDFNENNLIGSSAISYSKQLVGPTNASSESISTTNVSSISSTTIIKSITNETPLGSYTYKLTLGGKVLDVKFDVVESKPEIFLVDGTLEDENFGITYSYPGALLEDEVAVRLVNGVYEITKPYNSYNDQVLVSFDVVARNFADTDLTFNQFSVNLRGPSRFAVGTTDLYGGFETAVATSPTNSSLIGALAFGEFTSYDYTGGAEETSAKFTINQRIDYGTPVGEYTFNIRAGQIGQEISKDIKFKIVNPAPKLDFAVLQYVSSFTDGDTFVRNLEVKEASNGSLTIEKPMTDDTIFSLDLLVLLTNYHSVAENDQNLIIADQSRTEANRTLFTDDTVGIDNIASGSISDGYSRYLNYSMAVSGPNQALDSLTVISNRKVALVLETDADGIVLLSRTSQTINDLLIENEFGYQDYNLDTVVDLNDDTSLEITRDTIIGTYNVTFKVDNLTKVLSINVVNPTPKIFLMGDVEEYSSEDAPILYTLNGGSTLSSEIENGAYTIEKAAGDDLDFGVDQEVSIIDLAVNTYSFTVSRGFGSESPTSQSSNVVLSSSDENQLITGNAANNSFDTYWNIETESAEFGKYTFNFRIGTTTKTIVVNVVEKPTLNITRLTIDGEEVSSFEDNYLVPVDVTASDAQTIITEVSLARLPSDTFYKVTSVASGSEISVTNGLNSSTYFEVSGLKSITLGTLVTSDGTNESLDGDTLVFTVRFYELEDESYTEIGTPLIITLRATILGGNE
jgi:hypothetical protein